MIESAGLSMHQDITFLIKGDMAEHQIMQSMMRHVAREFATADMIAASLLATSILKADADQRAGIQTKNIEALLRNNPLNYPMALKHGLEKFGWQKFRHSEQGRAQEWHKDKKCDEQSESEFHDDDIALSNEDIAVFQSADHLLPQLQDEGLCSGIQLGLYRAFSTMGSFWRNNLVVILLPIGGQLGQRQAVFTILLRHGFEPRSIQGRVAMESGNPLQPLPMQELWYRSSSELVFKSSLVLDGQTLNGRSFLLGLVTNLPPARHWLDLDHRDLD